METTAKNEAEIRGTDRKEVRSLRFTLLAETAAELMTPFPVSIPADASVAQAVATMAGRRLSAIPVVDANRKPVGVLSRTDLFRPEGDGPAREWKVSEVMTAPVQVVAPDDGLDVVIRKMVGRNIHRVYVVDGWGRLAGVISTSDVVRSVMI